MFRSIRIQLIQPCLARCVWCSTHRKNPLFATLRQTGQSEVVHDLYLEVIARHRPQSVYISGGEPMRHPEIGELVGRIAEHCEEINLFTSYQFGREVVERFGALDLPLEKLRLNHTPIYFEPERWHKLTQGFPFPIYLDNVRAAVRLPVRKRFKFIINHNHLVKELQRFQELVEPDQTCEISLKPINDQGAGLVTDPMRQTASTVRGRLGDLDALLCDAGWTGQRPRTSIDRLRPVIESGDVGCCPFRAEPLELRLSLHKVKQDGKAVLKYRYCPYFPSDFGHRFHVGSDPVDRLSRNFRKGPFRSHCDRCRLLNYA